MANNTHTKIPVVCLMGTTATGKTDAAAALFDVIEAEIISVDSSLVYRDMNIGTAKPDADFLGRYPHHLVDIRDPNDSYSVADFYKDAKALVDKITQQGKVPVLAGGTMFYFNALEQGLSELPAANPELRLEISQAAEQEGWPALHQKLAALDQESASRIDPYDAQRIQRALEIIMTGGKPVAYYNRNRKPPIANPMLKLALNFSDRAQLHRRIELRFDQMLEQGLQQEVEDLLGNGVSPEAPSMRMIGYRQMLAYLQDQCSYNDMRVRGISATRQLAKRQLTWMRNQSDILWWTDSGLENKDFAPLVEFIRRFTG